MVQRFLWRADDMNADALSPFMIAALLDMSASLILQDANDAYLCITSLPDCWRVRADVAPADHSIFGEAIAGMLASAKGRVRQSGQTETIEVALDEGRHFEFRVMVYFIGDHRPQIITTIIDRSEDRRREKVLQSLLRDVSHRSKNLLAIIQSIAAQTSQHTDTIDSYVQKLRGRIFSLSRSQDLVTDSGWRGAFVRDLLEQQVTAYMPGGQEQVQFSGENVLLPPNVSMHLGLAFHELLVNAANYGTFLVAGDQISVTCEAEDEEGRKLRVAWNEPVNPRLRKAAGKKQIPVRRFGTAILERVVPASVDGQAEYSITPLSVHYELVFPADRANTA